MSGFDQVKTRLEKANQAHLLHFWNDLSSEDQNNFLAHLDTIQCETANDLFRQALVALEEGAKKLVGRMEPIAPSRFEAECSSTPAQLDTYRRVGLEAISNGHVAVVLLAGGQGTRLGVPCPKGICPIGLPSGKTLLQIQAERIRKLQELSRRETGKIGRITWYIMTSKPTTSATDEFLKTNGFFGLHHDDVVQFEQGMLPCFDMEGRLLLDEKNRVALAPDGNGGIYRALMTNQILPDMEKRGICYVHVHSVDNILVKVADPIFVGYCVAKQANCGAKVVRKTSPEEPVGVVCQVDGRFQVVEYSEITPSTASLRDEKGDLVFSAGSICNHFFSTKFLVELAEKHEKLLKLHVAKKKISFVNALGEKINPKEPNGIKMEKFIFDAFPFADHFVTWEVSRKTEFSAMKNSDDLEKDCPSSARKDLFLLHKRYVEEAGGTVVGDVVEISPLVSYAGEDLSQLVQGRVFQSPVVIDQDKGIGDY